MKETILYYHVQEEVLVFLKFLEKEMSIHIQEIQNQHISQKMGYLLGLPDFNENQNINQVIPTQPLLYFAFMNNQQLDIMLSMLRQANLPPLPYKAMMTESNLHFTFAKLYYEIQREHDKMTSQ